MDNSGAQYSARGSSQVRPRRENNAHGLGPLSVLFLVHETKNQTNEQSWKSNVIISVFKLWVSKYMEADHIGCGRIILFWHINFVVVKFCWSTMVMIGSTVAVEF